MPLKIHFSLHNPLDAKRRDLIPAAKVSVAEAFELLATYRAAFAGCPGLLSKFVPLHSSASPVEIHYTLIAGVNDGEAELAALCELSKAFEIPVKFIRFNPTASLAASAKETLWTSTLRQMCPLLGVKTYEPPGKAVGSSCGEFTKHYYHEEIETEAQRKDFEDWKAKFEIEGD